MAQQYSWDYAGDQPKSLANFTEHFFIRNGRVPGWSAGESFAANNSKV